jgi:Acyclic terpene utilisation family protein AtuA
VRLEQVARDRVAVMGAKGRQRTPTYKVTIGYFDGYIGEGQVSFGGPNAVARAKLGAEVVQARLKERGLIYPELQVDLIGYSSVHGELPSRPEPYEVRLRIAARTDDRRAAEAVGFETRALHMHGSAGAGGGSDPMVREILAVQSLLLPRELVSPEVGLEGQS